MRQALTRLDALIAEGVGAVEIKSGYGLDLATERKMLRAARRLGRDARRRREDDASSARMRCRRNTATGARPMSTMLVDEMLPALAAEGLVDAVDGFCETIAFSPEEIARVFDAARRLGLPVKLHAEQLSNQGGAALAASYGALSADHLEYLDDAGAAAMARGGNGGGAAARRLLHPARDARRRRSKRLRRHGVAHRGRHRLQPRHLAADLAADRAQHGGDLVPADGRGMSARRDPPRRARARAGERDGIAGSRQGGAFRDVGHRAPGGARLSHRLQSAASSRLGAAT